MLIPKNKIFLKFKLQTSHKIQKYMINQSSLLLSRCIHTVKSFGDVRISSRQVVFVSAIRQNVASNFGFSTSRMSHHNLLITYTVVSSSCSATIFSSPSFPLMLMSKCSLGQHYCAPRLVPLLLEEDLPVQGEQYPPSIVKSFGTGRMLSWRAVFVSTIW